MKPKKDISRMSIKRLKYRYGESGGADKVAEDELRRRGLTERQIRGVIHGYRQGEYSPRGRPYAHLDRKPIEKPAAPDEATEPQAAPDQEPIMHHGPFKGWPMAKVPEGYLEWAYGSFTQGRKRLEKELRSRGYEDEDFRRCRKKHPVRGKFPKKQSPKD